MKIIRTILAIPVGMILFSIADVIDLYAFKWLFSLNPLWILILYSFITAVQIFMIVGSSYLTYSLAYYKKIIYWIMGGTFVVGCIASAFRNIEGIPNWVNMYARGTDIFYFIIALVSYINDKAEEKKNTETAVI